MDLTASEIIKAETVRRDEMGRYQLRKLALEMAIQAGGGTNDDIIIRMAKAFEEYLKG